MSNFLIEAAQISNQSLRLILLQITLQKQLLKVSSVLFYILGPLLKVVEFTELSCK